MYNKFRKFFLSILYNFHIVYLFFIFYFFLCVYQFFFFNLSVFSPILLFFNLFFVWLFLNYIFIFNYVYHFQFLLKVISFLLKIDKIKSFFLKIHYFVSSNRILSKYYRFDIFNDNLLIFLNAYYQYIAILKQYFFVLTSRIVYFFYFFLNNIKSFVLMITYFLRWAISQLIRLYFSFFIMFKWFFTNLAILLSKLKKLFYVKIYVKIAFIFNNFFLKLLNFNRNVIDFFSYLYIFMSQSFWYFVNFLCIPYKFYLRVIETDRWKNFSLYLKNDWEKNGGDLRFIVESLYALIVVFIKSMYFLFLRLLYYFKKFKKYCKKYIFVFINFCYSFLPWFIPKVTVYILVFPVVAFNYTFKFSLFLFQFLVFCGVVSFLQIYYFLYSFFNNNFFFKYSFKKIVSLCILNPKFFIYCLNRFFINLCHLLYLTLFYLLYGLIDLFLLTFIIVKSVLNNFKSLVLFVYDYEIFLFFFKKLFLVYFYGEVYLKSVKSIIFRVSIKMFKIHIILFNFFFRVFTLDVIIIFFYMFFFIMNIVFIGVFLRLLLVYLLDVYCITFIFKKMYFCTCFYTNLLDLFSKFNYFNLTYDYFFFDYFCNDKFTTFIKPIDVATVVWYKDWIGNDYYNFGRRYLTYMTIKHNYLVDYLSKKNLPYREKRIKTRKFHSLHEFYSLYSDFYWYFKVDLFKLVRWKTPYILDKLDIVTETYNNIVRKSGPKVVLDLSDDKVYKTNFSKVKALLVYIVFYTLFKISLLSACFDDSDLVFMLWLKILFIYKYYIYNNSITIYVRYKIIPVLYEFVFSFSKFVKKLII